MGEKPEVTTNTILRLYDNTMRDGEQTVGVAFSVEDKVQIATQLVRTGINNFEAGFPAVSDEEREAIHAIIDKDLRANVFALARLRKRDVDEVVNAGGRHVSIFAPSSDAMIQAADRCSVQDIEDRISRVIDYAKSCGLLTRFSCLDATRTPLARLVRFYTLSYESGADYIGFSDTAGVGMPDKIADAIRALKQEINLPISVHCHNDLGLAVANSIAAARAGADEIQFTVNGLGERVGNTAMDEFVLAMKVGYEIDMGIDLIEMAELSRLLVEITGLGMAYNKPILGRNAFLHESGLHVRALMREGLETYEAFPPEWVGRKHEVAFGKHAGRSNVRFLCRQEGLILDPATEMGIVKRIKTLSQQRKREITHGEVLEMILQARDRTSPVDKQ